MSSQKGRPMSLVKKEAVDACSNTSVVKAAKEGLVGMDVLVCGTCLEVFHFIHEFHEHKKTVTCSKPQLDPAEFCSSVKIWAFMLWKNSPKTMQQYPDLSENVEMWEKWAEMDENKRRTWMTAGTMLWEVATINQSNVDEVTSEFEKVHGNKKKPMVTPVPLASLLRDPKLSSVLPTVALEKVFLPEGEVEDAPVAPVVSKKRTQSTKREEAEDNATRPKRAKTVVAAVERSSSIIDEVVSEINQEEGEEESQEYVVEAIVGKRYDNNTRDFLYEIKWEGFPSSQNTWEPEVNLTHCKPMIAEFEAKQKNTQSLSGRPVRSSKTKAMDKVKSWTGTKETSGNWSSSDSQFVPNVEIKIEEQDPLDTDFDAGNESDHSFDNARDSPFNPPSSDNSQDESPPKRTPLKVAPKINPKSVSTSTQPANKIGRPTKSVTTKKTPVKTTPVKAHPPPKPDPKASTLLVANSLGMVRVNAKALPDIKPGIYPIGKNEQLCRIKPLVPKSSKPSKSGLVVITNNPKVEKPGVRRKPLSQLTANKTPLPAKFQINAQQQQKSLIVNRPSDTKTSNASKQSTTSTTFVLPPNPGNMPYLVMAPSGSSVGALLITPTGSTGKPENNAAESKDNKIATKKPEQQTVNKTAANKEDDEKAVKENKSNSKDNAEKEETTKIGTTEKDNETMAMTTDDVSLAMEVSQQDSEPEPEPETVLDSSTGEIKVNQKTENKVKECVGKILEEKETDEEQNKTTVSTLSKETETSSSSQGDNIASTKIALNSQVTFDEDSTMIPLRYIIPEGVDPSTLKLPPNTQLMVTETGEYYLVPVQPEGSTLALAQDTTSGEMKMVSLPLGESQLGDLVTYNSQIPQQSVNVSSDEALATTDTEEVASNGNTGSGDNSKFFVITPDGEYMLVSDSQVNM